MSAVRSRRPKSLLAAALFASVAVALASCAAQETPIADSPVVSSATGEVEAGDPRVTETQAEPSNGSLVAKLDGILAYCEGTDRYTCSNSGTPQWLQLHEEFCSELLAPLEQALAPIGDPRVSAQAGSAGFDGGAPNQATGPVCRFLAFTDSQQTTASVAIHRGSFEKTCSPGTESTCQVIDVGDSALVSEGTAEVKYEMAATGGGWTVQVVIGYDGTSPKALLGSSMPDMLSELDSALR